MDKVIIVGVGGFIGASLRYLISEGTSKWFGNQFPFGTLIVNVIGGLLIGIIFELYISTDCITPNMKLFLTTGIMGGLTTFSTFSYETVTLLSNGDYFTGILNTCLNLFLSFGGVALGKYLCAMYI